MLCTVNSLFFKFGQVLRVKSHDFDISEVYIWERQNRVLSLSADAHKARLVMARIKLTEQAKILELVDENFVSGSDDHEVLP